MDTYGNVDEPPKALCWGNEAILKNSICMMTFIQDFQHLSIARDQEWGKGMTAKE